MAAKFSDYDFNHVFDLASLKNGGIRGQYIDNSFKDTIGLSNDTVDFTITPKGVDNLLDKNANPGVIFFKFFETHIIMLKYNVFNYKYLSKTINDCAKFINTYICDTIEKLNIAIATNNKVFERFNKAYKDKGISLDYPPLGYVRKPITDPSARETRINTIEKTIKNKIDQKEELELTFQVFNDELKYLKENSM